jgi:hypothetical protein
MLSSSFLKARLVRQASDFDPRLKRQTAVFSQFMGKASIDPHFCPDHAFNIVQ